MTKTTRNTVSPTTGQSKQWVTPNTHFSARTLFQTFSQIPNVTTVEADIRGGFGIGLKLVQDKPHHFCIAPAQNMPVDKFKGLLEEMAVRATRVFKKEGKAV